MIFDRSKVIFPNNLFNFFLYVKLFSQLLVTIILLVLNFFNDNCVFVSSNATYFLVINKMTTFMLIFNDNEGDLITITSYQNDFISYFIQATNNTNQFKLILQANKARNDPSNLIISYTDSYHRDVSFVQNITLEFYLFSFDPPSFEESLPIINADTVVDKKWAPTKKTSEKWSTNEKKLKMW